VQYTVTLVGTIIKDLLHMRSPYRIQIDCLTGSWLVGGMSVCCTAKTSMHVLLTPV